MEEKHLTDNEMVKMDLHQHEIKLINSEINALKKDIMILEMQKQINNLKSELLIKKMEDFKREAQAKSEKLNSKKEEIKEFNKKLAEKHELEGAWGYNPDTGLITQED